MMNRVMRRPGNDQGIKIQDLPRERTEHQASRSHHSSRPVTGRVANEKWTHLFQPETISRVCLCCSSMNETLREEGRRVTKLTHTILESRRSLSGEPGLRGSVRTSHMKSSSRGTGRL